MSDGADWIQKWVDYHRKDAVRILDFAHAMEYVSKGGQAAYEHLPLPYEDQRLSGQEAAKRQQKRLTFYHKSDRQQVVESKRKLRVSRKSESTRRKTSDDANIDTVVAAAVGGSHL